MRPHPDSLSGAAHGERQHALRIVVVDDQVMMRHGLMAMLRLVEGYDVVGEAGDGHAAVRVCRELQPDVVVMDLVLPRLNGIDASIQVLHDCPATRVIALTGHRWDFLVAEAIRCGAAGVLLKGEGSDELLAAVRAVGAGRSFVSPALATYVLDELRLSKSDRPAMRSHLSMREREVLQLAVEGLTSREIAAALCISKRTVDTHRSRISQALGIHTVAELVRYAMAEGIVTADTGARGVLAAPAEGAPLPAAGPDDSGLPER